MSTTKLMTIEEAEARRATVWDYELVRGEFRPLMPSGSEHSEVGLNIAAEVRAFVRLHSLGRVYGSDGGFILALNPDTLVAPDAAFVRADRIPARHVYRGFFPGAPDLAVEVISPSSDLSDLDLKVGLYLEAGVRMVWIADPESRTLRIHRPNLDPVVIPSDGDLDGDDVLPGFSVPIAVFFE